MTIKSFRNLFAPDLVASNPAVSSIQVDIDTYDTIAELPLSGNTEGKQAFVLSNKGLYIWNGTGWYNIALLSSDLALSQGANASYTLAKDGTASNVSLSASSTNAITWTHEIVGGSLTNGGGTTATIGQVGNTFTITPTTVEDYQGTFTVKFVGTDGTAYVGSESEFVLIWLYWYGSRGLFGGAASSNTTVEYITIVTPGNATIFGNLTSARYYLASCSNGTLGLFAGGYGYVSGAETSVIDYVTIATFGDASLFGNLLVGKRGLASCSDGTYGLFAGGTSNSNTQIGIEYVTIATTNNATSFGSLTFPGASGQSSCSDETRGLFAGGFNGTYSTKIDYVIIATPGNASSFGDLAVPSHYGASCSSRTYGIFGGGFDGTGKIATIDYVTIATTSNATSFGSLSELKMQSAACSDGIYGVFGGGDIGAPTFYSDVLEYVTFTTPGNATSFGSLISARSSHAACSGN